MACEVTVFPLAVKRQLKAWPEILERETRWMPIGEAMVLTDEEGLRPLLQALSEKLGRKRKPIPGKEQRRR